MYQSAMPRRGPAPDAALPTGPSVFFFIRWSLYLFAFLVPLENVNLLGGRNFTITKLAGLLFAGMALLQPTVCLALPPAAFWSLACYLVIWCVEGLLLVPDPYSALREPLMTFVQNMAMFWLCYNVVRSDKAGRGMLLSYVAGATAACVSILAGVGETVYATDSGERIVALGANANIFAYEIGVAVLIMVGLTLGRTRTKAIWTIPYLALALFLFYYVIQSGSRGGLLCVVAGMGVLLLRGGGVGTRLKIMFFGAIVVAAGAYVVLSSESAVLRITSTMEVGELAGREKIFTEAVKMFQQKPVFGWGPVNHLTVLAGQLQSELGLVDTHNDLLWAMTATGLVGTAFFVTGFGLCVRSAWRGRNATQGYLPLILILAAVVMSVSSTVHIRKLTWMISAYAAAASTYVVPPPKQRPQPRPERS
jgi:O-antigen ligase